MEKILPAIRLKYFSKPPGGQVTHPELSCAKCKKVGINIGGYRDAYTDNPKIICEECAIDEYIDEFDFKSREAAIGLRRRYFDIIYLFSEMLVDKYLKEKGLRHIDEISVKESNKIFSLGNKIYNSVYAAKEKDMLGQTENQKEIEDKFARIIKQVDFSKSFSRQSISPRGNFTKKQIEGLWGENGPYSQATMISEVRILDDSVSREFIRVEANINPTTFRLVKEKIDYFKNDVFILNILYGAHYEGSDFGYIACMFNEQATSKALEESKKILQETKEAIIRMHKFVMDLLKED